MDQLRSLDKKERKLRQNIKYWTFSDVHHLDVKEHKSFSKSLIKQLNPKDSRKMIIIFDHRLLFCKNQIMISDGMMTSIN